jgi:hypothetical protein
MQVRAYCHFLDFIAHFSKERKNSKSEKRLEEDVLSLSSLSLSFSLSFSLSLSLSLSSSLFPVANLLLSPIPTPAVR